MIEPGPVKTSFGDNLRQQLPSEEDMKIVDEQTKSLLEDFMARAPAHFAKMGQTAEDIAGVVLEAISSPNPHFRYLTNMEGYGVIAGEKFVDVTGDAPLEAMIKRSLPEKK